MLLPVDDSPGLSRAHTREPTPGGSTNVICSPLEIRQRLLGNAEGALPRIPSARRTADESERSLIMRKVKG